MYACFAHSVDGGLAVRVVQMRDDGDFLVEIKHSSMNSLGGKILRINADGSIPSDNPFKDSPIYTYGHRNPQGIAWIQGTDVMVSTEHGPSGFDGPRDGDDKIYRIVPTY